MGKDAITGIVSVLLAIIGVAVIAVIVSQKAQTTNVISSGGNAFISALKCAVSPITGGSCSSGGTSVTSTINYGGIL